MSRIAMAVTVLLGMAGAVAAEPVYGLWRTTKDDNGNYGHIQMAACGVKICGTLVQSFDETGAKVQSDNTGKQIIWGMSADGQSAYSGGKVWAPDRDKTYNSRMQLDGDLLSISGCILGICRDGGVWTRVN